MSLPPATDSTRLSFRTDGCCPEPDIAALGTDDPLASYTDILSRRFVDKYEAPLVVRNAARPSKGQRFLGDLRQSRGGRIRLRVLLIGWVRMIRDARALIVGVVDLARDRAVPVVVRRWWRCDGRQPRIRGLRGLRSSDVVLSLGSRDRRCWW